MPGRSPAGIGCMGQGRAAPPGGGGNLGPIPFMPGYGRKPGGGRCMSGGPAHNVAEHIQKLAGPRTMERRGGGGPLRSKTSPSRRVPLGSEH